VVDKNPSIAPHKQNRKRGYRRWDFCRTPFIIHNFIVLLRPKIFR
jgi:hypothetical protein